MAAGRGFRISDLRVSFRRWTLRLPFHYGVVTLTEADEVHVSAVVVRDSGAVATGVAAELAAPKWFNKAPDLTAPETAARLIAAVETAIAIAPGAYASVAALVDDLTGAMATAMPQFERLERQFAVALVERAAIDGLCRAAETPFPAFLAADSLGLSGEDDGGFIGHWLGGLRPNPQLAARHTVGLDDPLTRDEVRHHPPGRPVALEDVVRHDGVRRFKVKFGAGPDVPARLERLATLLATACPDYAVTLDANEAFGSAEEARAAFSCFSERPGLRRFWSRVVMVEQPLHRSVALDADVGGLCDKPIIVDESDDADDVFARALDRGYRGISIKTCKGVTRGVRNAARAARLREAGLPVLVSAEDLSVQPGIALQQNIALAAALGLTDAERNGHHFGPGPAALPTAEREAFERAHPDLYRAGGIVITHGALSAASTLAAAGFGTPVQPSIMHAGIAGPVAA